MIRGLDIWANQNNIEVKTPKRKQSKSVQAYELPMMYRAQVEGRCSLQYIKDNKSNDDSDLEKWINEWVDPHNQSGKPSVELPNTEEIIEEGKVTRYKLNFPFRVISNCGQDSILRPVIDS